MFAGGVTRETFTGTVGGRRHAVTALGRRLHIAALVLTAGCWGRSLIIERHLGLQLRMNEWEVCNNHTPTDCNVSGKPLDFITVSNPTCSASRELTATVHSQKQVYKWKVESLLLRLDSLVLINRNCKTVKYVWNLVPGNVNITNNDLFLLANIVCVTRA